MWLALTLNWFRSDLASSFVTAPLKWGDMAEFPVLYDADQRQTGPLPRCGAREDLIRFLSFIMGNMR